jgi:type IX secretion system substrate protein
VRSEERKANYTERRFVLKKILTQKTYIPILVFFCCFSAVDAQYTLKTGTFGNGAATITDSSNYQLSGTAGQSITGQSENNDYFCNSGFWYQSYYTIVGIEDLFDNIPKTFQLDQNFPNPFNPVTTIKYAVPKTAHVRLEIYNALGQRVATLVDANKQPGYYDISLNASHLASGIYFYRLHSEYFIKVKKLMVLK